MSAQYHKALRWFCKQLGYGPVTHQDKRDVFQDPEFKAKVMRDWRARRGR